MEQWNSSLRQSPPASLPRLSRRHPRPASCNGSSMLCQSHVPENVLFADSRVLVNCRTASNAFRFLPLSAGAQSLQLWRPLVAWTYLISRDRTLALSLREVPGLSRSACLQLRTAV